MASTTYSDRVETGSGLRGAKTDLLILYFLIDFPLAHWGAMPTIREIAEHLDQSGSRDWRGQTSKSTVHASLNRLEKEGIIEVERGENNRRLPGRIRVIDTEADYFIKFMEWDIADEKVT